MWLIIIIRCPQILLEFSRCSNRYEARPKPNIFPGPRVKQRMERLAKTSFFVIVRDENIPLDPNVKRNQWYVSANDATVDDPDALLAVLRGQCWQIFTIWESLKINW